jgi:hypothetical protein
MPPVRVILAPHQASPGRWPAQNGVPVLTDGERNGIAAGA